MSINRSLAIPIQNTSTALVAQNPVLLDGQVAQETDTNRSKVGDGTSTYTQLTYLEFPYEIVEASGTDTYIGNLGKPMLLAYFSMMRIRVKFTNANTGAATINLNSLGAKAIKKSVSTALGAGDIMAGGIYDLYYDGTNFQIQAAVGGTASTPALTATYVGFGSGTNVLTGSANFVWNGTTLSVGGADIMTINGAAVTSMIATNSNTQAIIEAHTYTATAGNGSVIYGARARGTKAAPTVVANGDTLAYYGAVGYDGTDYALGGYHAFIVDGTPGANDMPTKWILAVSADGTQTPTTALTISSTTAATFASTVSSTGYQISGAATSGTILRGDGTSYVASTNTYPNTTAANQILFATSANVIGGSTTFLTDGTYLRLGATAAITTEIVTFTKDQNALTSQFIKNNTSGTAAGSSLLLLTTSNAGWGLYTLSAGYTTSGMLVANTAVLSGSMSGGMNIGNSSNAPFTIWTNNTKKISIPAAGGLVVGTVALATTATDGFLYIPTCAGTPTGVPTAQTGTVAMVFDTTNNKLYIYDGGWLGGTTPGAFT